MGLTSYPNLAQLENSRIPIFEWKIATIQWSWIAIDRYFLFFFLVVDFERKEVRISNFIKTQLQMVSIAIFFFLRKISESFEFLTGSFDNDNLSNL